MVEVELMSVIMSLIPNITPGVTYQNLQHLSNWQVNL